VGVAYEMPTSEVSNINPSRIERTVFTEYLDPRTLDTMYTCAVTAVTKVKSQK
jgi:hypothetical protein